MSAPAFFAACAALLICCATRTHALKFFVAPDASDANDGLNASAPFQTPERARVAIAALKTQNNGTLPTGIDVSLAPGIYFLNDTLTLSTADTDPARRVVWAAAIPGTATLSGASPLSGWVQQNASNVWSTMLPAAFSQQLLRQLYDSNGTRYTLRETPTLLYSALYEDSQPVRIVVNTDDVPWPASALRAARVVLWHCWSTSQSRLASWDPRNTTLTLGSPLDDRYCWANNTAGGRRYAIQNVLDPAGLQPREFTYDPATREVTVRLDAAATTPPALIAPRLAMVVDITEGAANVTLNGLVIAHTEAFLEESCMDVSYPGGGSCNAQSANDQDLVALQVGNASDVSILNVEVALTGGHGVWVRGDASRTVIDRCSVHDIGAGGIRVGDGNSGDSTRPSSRARAVTSGLVISNSTIASMGDITAQGAGILLTMAANVRILHNSVHDVSSIAISLGSDYGYGSATNVDNEVAYNHVFNVGRGELSDMGCLYNLGVVQNSSWHHNLCHDVQSFDYGGWGLYADEGTSSLLMRDNVVHTTKSAGFHQHYGVDNDVTNNVFAFPVRWYCNATLMPNCDDAAVRSSQQPPGGGTHSISSFAFWANIILLQNASAALLYARNAPPGMSNMTFDNNTYWSTAVPAQSLSFPSNVNPGETLTFPQWQEEGYDTHGGVDDPQFVDAGGFDFSLKSSSPALARGFVLIDLSNVGPLPVG